MKKKSSKTVLVAPLDWGLGHATRCMPIIDKLIEHNFKVIIAGNGDSFLLLKEQYPFFKFYELPAYDITYPVGKNASIQILLQTPKVLRTIRKENKIVQQICATENIDLIISDNRYGVRHKEIKSIFICHQIAIQAPERLKFMNAILLRIHLSQIHLFDAVWIPDEEDEINNLSGILSHHIPFKIPYFYVGILSRFLNFVPQKSFFDNIEIDVLIILSGPEPQRSFLEEKLRSIFKNSSEIIIIIQGKTSTQTTTILGNITTISYLNTNDLYVAIEKTKTVICRSGYSSVMDLAVLGKKAVLIPTEGQSEQEYLAKTLSEKKYALYCSQQSLSNLQFYIKELALIKGFPPCFTNPNLLQKAIEIVFL